MKKTALFVGLVLMLSCKQTETPPIPLPKMSDILTDIHVAEYYSQGLGDDSIKRFKKNFDSLAYFYQSILQHHQVSYSSFDSAIVWLTERPLIMDSVYILVAANLEQLRNEYDTKTSDLKQVPPKGTDSSENKAAPTQ